ncbi:hypothetical protein CDEF62S_03748 [Castellaniella defragrans]
MASVTSTHGPGRGRSGTLLRRVGRKILGVQHRLVGWVGAGARIHHPHQAGQGGHTAHGGNARCWSPAAVATPPPAAGRRSHRRPARRPGRSGAAHRGPPTRSSAAAPRRRWCRRPARTCRSRKRREHHQRVTRDGNVHLFEVVLARAAHFHHAAGRSGNQYSPKELFGMFSSCSSSRSGRDFLSSGAAAMASSAAVTAGVVAAAQTTTLDEERRRGVRTAGDGTGEVALDTLDHRGAVEIRDEPFDVEPKLGGVADQMLALQRMLRVNTKSSHGQNIPWFAAASDAARQRSMRVVRQMRTTSGRPAVGRRSVPRPSACTQHAHSSPRTRALSASCSVLRPGIADLRFAWLKHHRQVMRSSSPHRWAAPDDQPTEQRGERHPGTPSQ